MNHQRRLHIQRALVIACQRGDLRLARIALRKGANPEHRPDGENPLVIIAAETGVIPLFDLLVRYGASPTATGRAGNNALHRAVARKHHDMAVHLLERYDFDPLARNTSGYTPFIIAAQKGDIRMLKRLVEYGANPHGIDNYGRSALDHAIRHQHLDLARILLFDYDLDPNQADDYWITPFLLAAESGDVPTLQCLIAHGANPTVRDYKGRNAFHYAVNARQIDIVRELIKNDAIDINARDEEGYTPFLIAAQDGNAPMLALLIQGGADPSITNIHGETALHLASYGGHADIVRDLILRLQFDPNSANLYGETPLMIAARRGRVLALKTLIALGANPYATDHFGRTALHHAASGRSDPTTIQYLVTCCHLDPHSQDDDGHTPLAIATEKGDLETIQTLLRLGASPFIHNNQGANAHAIAKRLGIDQYFMNFTDPIVRL